MALESHSLRSKVARRIFAVFLICTIVPFAGLLSISYYEVATYFNNRSQQQLRALAKIIGMEIFERLTLLESGLKIISSGNVNPDDLLTPSAIESLTFNPKDRWKAISLLSSTGRQRPLFGPMAWVPEFTLSDRQKLAAGKTLMKIVSTADGTSRIFIGLITRRRQTEPDILIGEIEDSYLWDFEKSRLIPNYVRLCITNDSGITVMCEAEGHGVERNNQAQNKIATEWNLPLKFEFQAPGWNIALETSGEAAFASIAEIKKPFLLGILISLGLSILFAIFSIRKRLVPVEQLQEGTRRIAQNEFSFRVNIRTNDEFEELANSVNAMADQLGGQFHTLKRQAAELESSNKMKDEFLGIVSHELRTPLNVILGYVRLLQEGMLGDLIAEQSRAVNTVAKHSQDLLEMIEAIVEATQIQAGAIRMEYQPVDLASVFDVLRSRYDMLPHGEAVTLSWFCAPDLPQLETDQAKLMRILQNLINNAIKFTDHGYISVSASCLLEQSMVEFRIEDTGIGIPRESQPFVFEMFRQSDSSKTREYGGIGLGLYIVNQLATLIGATVVVNSEPGRGSTFTVTVPLINKNAAVARARGYFTESPRAKTA